MLVWVCDITIAVQCSYGWLYERGESQSKGVRSNTESERCGAALSDRQMLVLLARKRLLQRTNNEFDRV